MKKKKVIPIGSDLRNPQIHKIVGIEKSELGLTDLIYKNDRDFKKAIKTFNIGNSELDVIISGSIPPNPTEIIADNYFEFLINELKNTYDYIVIDSALVFWFLIHLSYLDLLIKQYMF